MQGLCSVHSELRAVKGYYYAFRYFKIWLRTHRINKRFGNVMDKELQQCEEDYGNEEDYGSGDIGALCQKAEATYRKWVPYQYAFCKIRGEKYSKFFPSFQSIKDDCMVKAEERLEKEEKEEKSEEN